ncbi:MAG: response regulator transcription factor, partial [Chitinophagaceae bacterium]|nr:response regulator transcription factor [Chitinophagaceae bacterium]
MMNRIFFVEDDTNLGMLLKENMEHKGFETVWCKDGEEGMKKFRPGYFSLCILDVMLPMKDGFELSKEIRKVDPDVPFIFLTSRGMQNDRIKGFEYGCEDYITKPFSTQELYMRINVILRRLHQPATAANTNVFVVGKYTFDHTAMTLEINGEVEKLSSKECELLYMLVTNINVLVNRDVILRKVWGNDDYFSAKS